MKELDKKGKVAILFGATGLVGGHCLRLLLDSPDYKLVKVFGRREVLQAHPKLEQHVINFDRLQDHADLFRGDDVFCCLGTTMKKAGSKEAFYKVDFVYANELAKMTSQNEGTQFLLVSAIGAYSNSVFFYNKVKGELEDSVKLYPFEAVHIFRPSVLVGEREESRFGEGLAIRLGKAFDFMTSGVLLKYRPIEGEKVAAVMLAKAKENKKGLFFYESDMIQRNFDA